MAIVAHKLFLYSVVLFWMFVAIYFFTDYSSTSSGIVDELEATLRVMGEMEKQNLQLKEIAKQIRSLEVKKAEADKLNELLNSLKKDLSVCQSKRNQLLQEEERRVSRQGQLQDTQGTFSSYSNILAIQNQVHEIGYYVQSKLKSLEMTRNLPNETSIEIHNMMEDMKSRTRAALIEIELMKENQKNQQVREMKILEEMVRRKIHLIQNPDDCSTARKIVCDMSKSCGFGCQLHHVTYCFIVAIATDRTLILKSKGWKYSPDGWESIFLKLSDNCTASSGQRSVWKGYDAHEGDLTIGLPIIDRLQKKPPHLPLSIPDQLAPKLTTYHGNPPAWWIGQLVKYIVRPQPWLAETIQNYEKNIGFQHPIVGIHIRRTDKVGSEAAFHSVDEYMEFVVEWYDKEDMMRQRLGKTKISSRTVFIASDDPNVHSEAVKRYPDYKFVGDASVSKGAAVHSRYNKASLTGVICDIAVLSKCDYLVGTFSSQVSRAAYEIMQTLHPDAASFAHSLDDIFYFGGQHAHSQKALYDHKARSNSQEFDFEAGDTIGIAGNHWDGYSKGVNRRIRQGGLYPSYKVEEMINTVKFPPFPEVDNMMLNYTSDVN